MTYAIQFGIRTLVRRFMFMSESRWFGDFGIMVQKLQRESLGVGWFLMMFLDKTLEDLSLLNNCSLHLAI